MKQIKLQDSMKMLRYLCYNNYDNNYILKLNKKGKQDEKMDFSTNNDFYY